MAMQQTANEKPEVEFLEDIRHRLLLNNESKKWNIQTKIHENYMTLTIESIKKIDEDEINLIVEVLSDNELFRFEKLRQLGWCSGYNLSDCEPKHLEFTWMNLRAIRPLSKKNLIGEICSCTICRIRFDN